MQQQQSIPQLNEFTLKQLHKGNTFSFDQFAEKHKLSHAWMGERLQEESEKLFASGKEDQGTRVAILSIHHFGLMEFDVEQQQQQQHQFTFRTKVQDKVKTFENKKISKLDKENQAQNVLSPQRKNKTSKRTFGTPIKQ
eukprot:TRINITY_DN116_c1_g2_i1.p1 TRINITY_DN116_c1_g2~~TRINITY_DN116_c1_g2_i1.p1  ORF type:complete len:139 (+),score=51.88 TRINITY_DN116_c1_g2_i1:166-582(+)